MLQQVTNQRVAQLKGRLPYAAGDSGCIDLTVIGQQRIGVVGPNGCGKTTLLKVLAGQLQPASGSCTLMVESTYLDQQLATLKPDTSVLEQLLALNRTVGESKLRMRLAQLGLDTLKANVACRLLSGGERLKAALACALYADIPAQLLLLDEPSNHLDLTSLKRWKICCAAIRGQCWLFPMTMCLWSNWG